MFVAGDGRPATEVERLPFAPALVMGVSLCGSASAVDLASGNVPGRAAVHEVASEAGVPVVGDEPFAADLCAGGVVLPRSYAWRGVGGRGGCEQAGEDREGRGFAFVGGAAHGGFPFWVVWCRAGAG